MEDELKRPELAQDKVVEPDGNSGPDPEPENPTEHYRRKKGIN